MKNLLFACLLLVAFAGARAQKIPSWKISRLEEFIRASPGPVIVNFWATFCKPCLEEIPYFEGIAKSYKKYQVRVLLVSLDLQEQYPGGIASYIAKRKIASSVVWLNETNADYFCPKIDSSWTGSLPASLFINNKTGYRKFYEEPVSKERLETELREMLRP